MHSGDDNDVDSDLGRVDAGRTGRPGAGEVHILRRELAHFGAELQVMTDLVAKGGTANLSEAGRKCVQTQRPLSSLKRRIGKVKDTAVRASLERRREELNAQMEAIRPRIPDEFIDAVTAGTPKETGESTAETSTENSIAAEVQDIVGNFGTVGQEVAGARLTQDGDIIVDVEDIVRALDGVMREFKEFKGRYVDRRIQQVNQQSNMFNKRYQEWDRRAKQKEAIAKRGGLEKSKARKMEAEHHGVRNRYPLALKQFQRLLYSLEQFQSKIEAQAASPDVEPAELPQGFVDAFGAAPAQKRAVVHQYFEIEAEITVIREETADGGHRIYLDPFPPTNRFYFLVDTEQVIRICGAKIGKVVHVQHPETGRNDDISFKDFFAHVQKGVWLLRSRSLAP